MCNSRKPSFWNDLVSLKFPLHMGYVHKPKGEISVWINNEFGRNRKDVGKSAIFYTSKFLYISIYNKNLYLLFVIQAYLPKMSFFQQRVRP